MEYTKGEWSYDETDIFVSDGSNCEGDLICLAPLEYSRSMQNWEANAKLIACAPELLEALKESIRLLYGTTEFEVIESYRKKLDDFEQLIKKAT